MKNNSKKLCSFLMSIVLVVSLLSGAAFAVAADDLADDTVAVINVGGRVLEYPSLSAAIDVAKQGSLRVYLVKEYKLPTDLEIPSNVTVVIPTSSDYVVDSDPQGGANVGNTTAPAGSAYVSLTVPSGVELTVDGTLIVAGNQQGYNPHTGFLTGNYGAVDVEGSLIVNGSLYARGKVYTETTGTVTANEKARVYQRLEIADWRGGTGASIAYLAKVFPFNLYELSGISTELICKNGATLYAQAFIYASNQGVSVNVPYVASSGNGMIRFSGTGGDIRFTKTGDITNITVNADLETGNLSFEEDVDGESYPIDSNGLVCPFGYHTNLLISKGSSVTVKTLLKFLPGCQVTVDEGASLTIGEIVENEDGTKTTTEGAAYFYTAADYSNTYNWAKWPAEGVSVANAELKAPAGAIELIAGKIGSTSADLLNLPDSFTPVEGEAGTAQITEFIQGSPIYLSSTKDVTFHLANPAA